MDRPALILLLVYAAIVLSSLGLTPLWLDEIVQLDIARRANFHELLRGVQVNAGASPLPYLVQHAVVQWFGHSTFAARFPAALCSLLSGVVFAALVQRFRDRSRWVALLLFLALPVQFRYGLEARVYSQGLLFSLLTLWLFLRLKEHSWFGGAVLYALAVAAGLYSQPLTVFPVLAQLVLAPPAAIVSAGLGVASYLPWYVAQHRVRAEYALIAPPTSFFSLKQMHPLTLIHDLAGDGYVCSVALIILIAWALGTSSKSRLLYCTLAFSLVGPIAMDAVFNYFYAPRQLLFAAPALVLLAAQGFERLRADSHGLIAWSLLAAFFIAACVTNYRQAVIPRDSLARTADAIAARLRPGVCVMAVPKGHIAFYSFFHPELESRACPDHSSTREIVAAVSVYTTPDERRAFEDSISASFEPRETVRVGQSEITTYAPR